MLLVLAWWHGSWHVCMLACLGPGVRQVFVREVECALRRVCFWWPRLRQVDKCLRKLFRCLPPLRLQAPSAHSLDAWNLGEAQRAVGWRVEEL